MKKSYKSGPRNGGLPQGALLFSNEKEETKIQTVSSSPLDENIKEPIVELEPVNQGNKLDEDENEDETNSTMSDAARLRAEAVLSRSGGNRAVNKKRTSTKS